MSAHRPMIMSAPNGARKTKADHAALPLSPDELAADAESCAKAGASAIHLHVRAKDGSHSLDAALYRDALKAVTERAGAHMVIQITTEAVGRYAPREQMDCVRAVRPAAVSLALKELVPADSALAEAKEFFRWLQGEQISPQFILYDAGEMTRFKRLCESGVIAFSHPFVLFVLGRYAADGQSEPAELDPFLARLDGFDGQFACCAFGRREAACSLYAAQNGGHIRVGFENNLHLPDGTLAASNAHSLVATVSLLAEHAMAPADISQTRKLIRRAAL